MKHILRAIVLATILLLAVAGPAYAARTDSQWDSAFGTYIYPNGSPTGQNVLIIGQNHYLNFGTFSGSSGYGFRDNSGIMEFKNSGGVWTAIGSGGGGGGSGGGTFSTTTSPVSGELFNYSNNTTDIVLVGGVSSTTAKFYFDPNLPFAKLGGDTLITGSTTLQNFTFINATGTQARLGDGSNTLPAFSFSADPDTGVYRGGTNVLSFSAGGSSLSWSSTGPSLRPNSDLGGSLGQSGQRFKDVWAGGTATSTALVATELATAAGTFLAADPNGHLIATTTPAGVSSISIASANGFAGSSSGGSTPALTLSTSISGVLKGNGTAISAASNGTDYTLITANTCSAGQHVSAVSAAGVITCSADTTASSTLLGDNNTFSGTNQFNKLTFTNATGTNATTSAFAITSLATPAGTFLAVNANGSVIATTTPSGGSSASSTLLADNNGFTGLNTFTDLKLVSRSTTTNATTTGTLFVGSGTASSNALLTVDAGGSHPFSIFSNGIETTPFFDIDAGSRALFNGNTTAVSPAAEVTIEHDFSTRFDPALGTGNPANYPFYLQNTSSINASTTGLAFGVTNATGSAGAGIVFTRTNSNTQGKLDFLTHTNTTAGSALTDVLTLTDTGIASTTNLLVNGSSTLQNFTSLNATSTNATSTTLNTATFTLTGATTGCATFTGTALSSTGVACGSGSGSSYPFPLTGNATSTLTQFNGGLTAFASSTISALTATNATSTHATTTDFTISGLATAAGTFIAVDPTGKVIATTTPINTGGSSEGVQYATAAVLSGTPTYSNGTSGVGATLTEVGTGALSVDGTAVSIGDRVLVKNQASAFQNGIYSVTATGSGIASYILTRATDYNSPTEITPGLTTYVVSGSVNNDLTYAVSFTSPLTIGTTNLTYALASGGSAAVSSVSNSDGTLTISPTTGNVIASLALGHANTWTGSQMLLASTTIGNNTAAGGLTVNGTATTTGIANLNQVQLQASQPATTTALTLDWSLTPSQVEYQIGTSATTITLINATTSPWWGSRKLVWVCNPGASAGAITWAGVEWIGTAPTQTTTAGQCDVYSFDVTHATSTTAYKVAGSGGSGFQ